MDFSQASQYVSDYDSTIANNADIQKFTDKYSAEWFGLREDQGCEYLAGILSTLVAAKNIVSEGM